MDNPIVLMAKDVFATLLTLDVLIIGGLQVVKEKYIKSGQVAEIVSLIVGFVTSGLVCWYYAEAASYQLELGQWIGLGIGFVIGGLGPAGGYKLAAEFSGKRTPDN